VQPIFQFTDRKARGSQNPSPLEAGKGTASTRLHKMADYAML